MISVITVSFNAETYIENTVRSILEQTDEQFEFLLVDGDSHDNTVKVVKNLLEEYGFPNSRFILIQEKDKGVYDAMNKGVTACHGDYVLFMNGGDSFYDKNVIATFENIAFQNKADAYYGDTMMEFYEGKGILHDNEESNRNAVMPFIHQSVIVKRSLLKEHPFNLKYKILADNEFFYWMRKNGCKFYYENFIVSNYDAREGLSENNPYQIEIERDEIMGRNLKPFYFVRKIKLRCTKGLIQPIKDYAPKWLLNKYFIWKKKNIDWIEIY